MCNQRGRFDNFEYLSQIHQKENQLGRFDDFD